MPSYPITLRLTINADDYEKGHKRLTTLFQWLIPYLQMTAFENLITRWQIGDGPYEIRDVNETH